MKYNYASIFSRDLFNNFLFLLITFIIKIQGVTAQENSNHFLNHLTNTGNHGLSFNIPGFSSNHGVCENNGNCQHTCEVFRGNLKKCSCNRGYVLTNDFHTCKDLDECSLTIDKPCEDKCENTIGSYKCSCSGDAVLHSDKRSCIIPSSPNINVQLDPDNDATSHIHPNFPTLALQPAGAANLPGSNLAGSRPQPSFPSLPVTNTNDPSGFARPLGFDTANSDIKPSSPSLTLSNRPLNFGRPSGSNIPTSNTRPVVINQPSVSSHPQPTFTLPKPDDHSSGQPSLSFPAGINLRPQRPLFRPNAGGPPFGNRPNRPSNSPHSSCSVNNGGCEQECIMRRRVKTCRCSKGFTLARDGLACEDIDECTRGLDNCPFGSCVNTAGSYICNPCANQNGGCEQKCDFVNGIVACSCNEGFTLVQNRRCRPLRGQGGQNRNPCKRNNGRCDHICNNVNGRRQCSCKPGYTLINRRECRPETTAQDPCSSAGCEHQCRIANSEAKCFCNPGFKMVDGHCIADPLPQPPVLPTISPPAPPIVTPLSAQPTTASPATPPLTNPPPVKTTEIPFEVCGINANKSLIRRIVGGSAAHPEDWKWMAALLKEKDTDSFCGGALIDLDIVLTAAHCVSAFTAQEIRVRLGDYDFSKTDDRSPQNFDVLEIRIHENYSLETNANDIAVLKLNRPAILNNYVRTICLPKSEEEYAGKPGIVTGWGTIYFGGPVSAALQEVVIPVWTKEDCVNAYKERIHPGMMCAGIPEGGRDSCQGDSGGPFMMQDADTYQFYVAGVVSWGIECASPNRPGVYTVVRDFLEWIAANSY